MSQTTLSNKPCPACKHPGVYSRPQTFDDLRVDHLFVIFPSDGDDSGHGGFRGAHRLFKKTSHKTKDGLVPNSVAVGTGTPSHWPAGVRVLEILA